VQLFDAISGRDGQKLDWLAKDLDLSPAQTATVVQAILPEFRHFIERKTLSRDGLAEMIQTLGAARHSHYLEKGGDLASRDAIAHGNQLLGEILQTKYRSRALADQAARQTGVPADKIRQLLPRIATVSMAALAEQTRPALEDIFAKLPGFPANPTTPKQAGSPLPLPDDNWGGGAANRNGYDDLSDILRRPQRPLSSNPVWTIARQILGTVMGFESKGIIGYIIRFFVYRFGWRILRMIIARFFRV
jgi:hypothetical protein